MAAPLTAALVHPAATARPRRERPQRNEREKLRAQAARKALATTPSAAAPAPAPASVTELSPSNAKSLDWLPLAEPAAATCPVVFSPDAAYCFVASGAHVKIYSTSTTELMSTLSSRIPSPSLSQHRSSVTSILLHPSNPRQLVIGSTNGTVQIWDYLEGRLLRTLDVQSPVTHATAHPSLPDQLFVALANPPLNGDADAKTKSIHHTRRKIRPEERDLQEGETLAGVYMVSLRAKRVQNHSKDAGNEPRPAVDPSVPVPPSRRIRLALPRCVRALALSPSGSTLLSLNPHAINLCRTATLQQGFTRSIPVNDEVLTTVAFHPTENYFATGNTRGQVRLWYNVLDKPNSEQADERKAPTTALLHWHVHPVSALSFTPNGAYLLSGGREAVMVLWQLHTGHQEYVPRVGAPILTLTVVENGEGGEQQVAMRLADGSVAFVGSQKLKVGKTIAGLKSDIVAPRSAFHAQSRPTAPTPLAYDQALKCLVLPSSHPSSLQFYSPSTDSQTLELEISPSNRVSSASDTPIEPTRVERVAFSAPAKDGRGYWMATVDEWRSGSYAAVRQLKLWRNKGDGPTFSLSTRIDRPHDSPITSLSFSPSAASPLLLTTSLDGRLKVWAPAADGSWRCRTSLLHRPAASSSSLNAPVASAWAQDGSMFAVAHEGSRTVTLWSLASGEPIHSFVGSNVGKPKDVRFTGKEGTGVMLVGSEGAVAWDLMTLEETFASSIAFSALTSSSSSPTLYGAEAPSSPDSKQSLLYIVDPSPASSSSSSTAQIRALPFPIRQSITLPSALSSSSDDLSLAAVDSHGRVALLGAAAGSSSSGSDAGGVGASRLPTASVGESRLFDEIFGARTKDALVTKPEGTDKGKLTLGGLELLDTPAHSLPPVRLLWREMLRGAPPPLPPSALAPTAAAAADQVAKAQRAANGAGEAGRVVFGDSPGTLEGIFRARLSLGTLFYLVSPGLSVLSFRALLFTECMV
ncbi:hypothetical protein JCM21900_000793 [Sporobolomyces salmonicolor]